MSGRSTAIKRARQIREVLLDYGAPEVSIEVKMGRPSGSDRWNAMNPVGLMGHHIVSRPTPSNPTPGLNLVKNGRPGLSGPLCNGTGGVDLVYRIICLGYANHPGHGGPIVVRGPLGNFRIPASNARPYLWGTEWEGGYSDAVWDRTYKNRRTGKRMTFREFMGRCNAGLAEAIWLPGINTRGKYDDIHSGMDLSGYHMEHSTWTSRKIDRLNYSTHDGRAEIRRFGKKEEDDMPSPKDWTKADWNAINENLGMDVRTLDGDQTAAGLLSAIARGTNTSTETVALLNSMFGGQGDVRALGGEQKEISLNNLPLRTHNMSAETLDLVRKIADAVTDLQKQIEGETEEQPGGDDEGR